MVRRLSIDEREKVAFSTLQYGTLPIFKDAKNGEFFQPHHGEPFPYVKGCARCMGEQAPCPEHSRESFEVSRWHVGLPDG